MPKKRTRPYLPGDTYYATLAKDGSDAEIAEVLNRDPAQAPNVVREAMKLYAAVQRGEIPPELVTQWQQWARADLAQQAAQAMTGELAAQVAQLVIAELQRRNLVASASLTPHVHISLAQRKSETRFQPLWRLPARTDPQGGSPDRPPPAAGGMG